MTKPTSLTWNQDFHGDSAGKESASNGGDLGSIPGLWRLPVEGSGYPLQYSGQENSTDCVVHGVTKCWAWLSNFQAWNLVKDWWWYLFVSWDYKWKPGTAFFEVSPTSKQTAAWDLFPTRTLDMLWHRISPCCLSLDVGQNPIWWCILCSFYFSFLLMLVY